jgi:hypothetical protein
VAARLDWRQGAKNTPTRERVDAQPFHYIGARGQGSMAAVARKTGSAATANPEPGSKIENHRIKDNVDKYPTP